jgi:diaminohydroxyphosphoribosylaminopyrimidine deaminase/5-amino-6-(5-phosphoribosylamino)uracil reductase
MNTDELYMQQCIELAANGFGNVAPNPMTGSVIVHDEKIIGEGFHQQFGKEHAEVNAINAVIKKYGEEKANELLQHAILYVNLEPCSHHGKTPPCADLIIENKIPSVVIGTSDTSSNVNGKGITRLKEAGCELKVGVLEKECRELNIRFYTYHEKQRPYIILKYAQSADGIIASENINESNRWISNEYSRKLLHKWRSEEQAVMIGTNTAMIDNPSLTVREWKGKNPTRIVIDKELKLKSDLKIFDGSAPTIIFNSAKTSFQNNLEFMEIDFGKNIHQHMLNHLHKKNIQSVIIEGGTKLLQSFIDEKLWDEARIFISDKFIGGGTKAPLIAGEKINETQIVNDRLIYLKNISH